MLALLWSGCAEPPEEEWSALQSLRRDLLRDRPAYWFPEEFAAFESECLALTTEMARLRSEFRWLRTESKREATAARIRALLAAGRHLAARVAEERSRRREELTAELGELETLLSPRHSRIVAPELRRLRARFEIELQRCRVLLSEGGVEDAEAVLPRLREAAGEFVQSLRQFEERFADPALHRWWEGLCRRAVRLSQDKPGVLLVDKHRRRLYVLRKGLVTADFDVDLGWNGLEQKRYAGDGATPEGLYEVVERRSGRSTRYYLALLLNYPNDEDRRRFRELRRKGLIPAGRRIGGLIEIHGDGGQGLDWTDGCIALENGDMEALFREAYVGMPVVIVGRCDAPSGSGAGAR
ncbi:MAG: hypothetical protein Kow00109_16080 [Acidobacteriota bacterium]